MRFVDLQTLLPRAAEASRTQEAAQRQPQAAQAATADQLRVSAEQKLRQVQRSERPEQRRVKSSTEEERRQAGRGDSRGRRGRSAVPGVPGDRGKEPPARARLSPPGLGQHVDVDA